jgi:stearoyl-CoA desaturase (delta-9 desaturase)
MASSSAVEAKAFPDGTTDYVPLRNKKADLTKVHIFDTPTTWSNWYQHVNWLNTTFIIFVPLAGFISAYWVPLQLSTAIFAVIYYFNTGLGITAGMFSLSSTKCQFSHHFMRILTIS